uniref:Wall-associated receptor kinase galacturonan-binding domain-containing protein n=1 Tax=Manihot esculenta TaxID=3983 RepID=A0A2C9VFD9_MANES
MFLIYFLLGLVTQVSAPDACPKCGSMEVPYPLSRGDTCGDPSINPSAYKLVIEPPMIQKNTCYSAELAFGGLKLAENLPFNISTHNTVLLFNCSENILLSPLNCSSTSYCKEYEAEERESGCKDTLCCHFLKDASMTQYRIRVRVGGCRAYTSVVDLKPGDPVDAWNYGIELQWLPPNLPF